MGRMGRKGEPMWLQGAQQQRPAFGDPGPGQPAGGCQAGRMEQVWSSSLHGNVTARPPRGLKA